jgi:hypothetical protein
VRFLREAYVSIAPGAPTRAAPAYVEKAARVLLQGDSGRDADPIVIDAVARILERVADHAELLEFGLNGAERVAAAETLEKVQELLVKLTPPRRAEFAELVQEYALRFSALADEEDEAATRALADEFVSAAMRIDRAFRRLSEASVRREFTRLGSAKAERGKKRVALSSIAAALSLSVGAFNDRQPKRAAAAFEAALKPARGAKKAANRRKR